jgi:hypothetical protein
MNLHTLTSPSFLNRKIAIDEHGLPSWADGLYCHYTPGKPHPYVYEFFVAVDSNGFAFHIVWPPDTTAKYEPSTITTCQMTDYFDYFTSLTQSYQPSEQPFIFYIDAWGSLQVMHEPNAWGMFGVLSIGENASPQHLWLLTNFSNIEPVDYENIVASHPPKLTLSKLLKFSRSTMLSSVKSINSIRPIASECQSARMRM